MAWARRRLGWDSKSRAARMAFFLFGLVGWMFARLN